MTTMTYVMRYLWANGVKFRVVGRVPTFLTHYVDSTAHVPAETFAKTILAKTDHQYWLVVVSSDVDVNKIALRTALHAKQLDLLTDADLETLIPDCRVKGIAPFGALYGFPVVVEKSVAVQREIAFNPGSRTDFISMRFDDYERLVQPIVAEFAASSLFGRRRTAVGKISPANRIEHVPMLLKAARKAGDVIPALSGVSMQRSGV